MQNRTTQFDDAIFEYETPNNPIELNNFLYSVPKMLRLHYLASVVGQAKLHLYLTEWTSLDSLLNSISPADQYCFIVNIIGKDYYKNVVSSINIFARMQQPSSLKIKLIKNVFTTDELKLMVSQMSSKDGWALNELMRYTPSHLQLHLLDPMSLKDKIIYWGHISSLTAAISPDNRLAFLNSLDIDWLSHLIRDTGIMHYLRQSLTRHELNQFQIKLKEFEDIDPNGQCKLVSSAEANRIQQHLFTRSIFYRKSGIIKSSTRVENFPYLNSETIKSNPTFYLTSKSYAETNAANTAIINIFSLIPLTLFLLKFIYDVCVRFLIDKNKQPIKKHSIK